MSCKIQCYLVSNVFILKTWLISEGSTSCLERRGSGHHQISAFEHVWGSEKLSTIAQFNLVHCNFLLPLNSCLCFRIFTVVYENPF